MPADQIRNRTVGCKMSDSEYERLSAVVESEGMTLGEWCREVLLERADGRKPSVIEETLLAEVLALRTILLNAFYKLANDLGGQGSWSPRGEEQETGSEFDTVNYSCCDFVTSKQPTAEDGGDSADSTPSASQQPAQQSQPQNQMSQPETVVVVTSDTTHDVIPAPGQMPVTERNVVFTV